MELIPGLLKCLQIRAQLSFGYSVGNLQRTDVFLQLLRFLSLSVHIQVCSNVHKKHVDDLSIINISFIIQVAIANPKVDNIWKVMLTRT